MQHFAAGYGKWASLRDKVIGSLRVVGCRNDDGQCGLLLPGKLQGCNGDEGGVARVSDGRRNQQRFHVGARGRQVKVLARNILCFTPFFLIAKPIPSAAFTWQTFSAVDGGNLH
ncbi:uncharacterized protein HKW66_Vig0238670 [Vigna angularis]|uniref:Uncharacterized protein n=1 Tax=Phaseolus angularis TaxID=3914 RepID=A0A8T0KR44_PHAAN|nr:uncharacterized protein HKW66_Vig0238670 [Vigna angularis]